MRAIPPFQDFCQVDAAALVHQLRAMGPAQRADVGSVEERARERLRQQREAGDALWSEPDGESD